MQKLVQKAVFAALLVSSSAFAEGDLLSKATDGAVTTAKAEVVALSDGEMRDVKGGLTWYSWYTGAGSSYWNSNTRATTSTTSSSSIYARSFGSSYWGRRY